MPHPPAAHRQSADHAYGFEAENDEHDEYDDSMQPNTATPYKQCITNILQAHPQLPDIGE